MPASCPSTRTRRCVPAGEGEEERRGEEGLGWEEMVRVGKVWEEERNPVVEGGKERAKAVETKAGRASEERFPGDREGRD